MVGGDEGIEIHSDDDPNRAFGRPARDPGTTPVRQRLRAVRGGHTVEVTIPTPPPAGAHDAHAAAYGGGIVTGDAVVVELRLAKLPSRSMGFAIDFALQMAVLFGLLFLAGAVGGYVDATMAAVVVFVLVIAVLVGYPVAAETLTRGRTIGKLAVGLRVVRDDGGPERFRHALARGLMGFVELYLFCPIAIICSLVSPEGKRVGDYLAGTVVVRERAPSAGAPLPGVHAGWEAWAAALDLSQLPDPLLLQLRAFVTRAPTLAPAARQQIAGQLAARLGVLVPVQRPPWLSDEVFCQLVLAERRRRALHTSPPAVVAPPRPAAIDPAPPPGRPTPDLPDGPDRWPGPAAPEAPAQAPPGGPSVTPPS
jgi:uncharacterized RDD family membrane protein YckC